ncbi:MAG: signal recognition particle-docking protein FtsY [Candidatus Woesearchaeota archaeon]
MFSNLKKKLKRTLQSGKSKGSEEILEEKDTVEQPTEEKEDNKTIINKIKDKITKIKVNEERFEKLYEDIKIMLLENNIAYEILELIKEDLKKELLGKELSRFKIDEITKRTLKETIKEILKKSKPKENLLHLEKKPKIILFCGINGSGKTTSIAKISKKIKNNDLKSVMVAADTFRAAAIDQIQTHADNLEIKLIKHDYGSDPAAVVYDGVEYSKSKEMDFVLVDTAGRTNMNENLINELKKISRVSNPDKKVLVVDSLVGNDIVDQAEKFDDAIVIDGIIVTKVDANKKGGSIISISYLLGKPIYYLGNGQEYDDLIEFDPEKIVEEMFENEDSK